MPDLTGRGAGTRPTPTRRMLLPAPTWFGHRGHRDNGLVVESPLHGNDGETTLTASGLFVTSRRGAVRAGTPDLQHRLRRRRHRRHSGGALP